MTRFVEMLTVALLLAPQIAASICAEGSCTDANDVTNFVQVKKIVKTGAERQDPLVMNAADDQMVQDVSDAVHDDVMEKEMIADSIKDNDGAVVVGASVLPPPVGHGRMEDNPTVADWKAETATMPGVPGGSVVQAYDSAMARTLDPVRNPLVQQMARDIAHQDEAARFNAEMANSVHADEDATAATYQAAADSILDTAADTDEVDKAAIHTVEGAREHYEEAAIAKDQTEAAALAGHAQGEKIGLENAMQSISEMTNARTRAALKKSREELLMARDKEIAEGITAADDVQAQMEADGRYYASHEMKANEAARAHVVRDANLVRTQIEGAQGIENHVATQDALREANTLNRATEGAEEDIAQTIAEGAPYVARDMIADAVAPDKVGADTAVLFPGAAIGDPLGNAMEVAAVVDSR